MTTLELTKIDTKAEPLEPEEVEGIKIYGNGPTLEAFSKFMDETHPITKLTLEEFLTIIGAKQGKYTAVQVQRALLWADLPEANRNKLLEEDPEIPVALYDQIVTEKTADSQRLVDAILGLIRTLAAEGIVDGQPTGLFDTFLDLLVIASNKKVDKSRLFMSDFTTWLELFIRIFIKQSGSIGKSFFIKQGIEKLLKAVPLLNFMKNETLNTLKNEY